MIRSLIALILCSGLGTTANIHFSEALAVPAHASAMPEPAPPIHRQVKALSTAEKIPSFRVQTDSNPALAGNVYAGATTGAGTVIETNPSSPPAPAQVPPETFRAWLEQSHPDFALRTSTISSASVLEVKGVYDNSSRTLRSLGIPFEQVAGRDLVDMPLAGVKVIVVNCPGRVPQQAFQNVRDFVARGGYLLTTDWSSDNLVERAFPGYIQWDRHTNKQSVYDAQIVRSDPALFARTVTNASWKMDIDSHMIRPLNENVRVLAISKQLAVEDQGSRGVLAVVFPFGRGYVLHMVGHFDNNTILPFRNMLSDPAPVIGISLRQAIAANFVVAALSATRLRIR